MSKRGLSDKQIKADLMHRLFRKRCWGARYFPRDTLVRWLSRKVKRNGRRVLRLVRQLINDGYLLLHKRGETISLNPAKSGEVMEFIRRFLV